MVFCMYLHHTVPLYRGAIEIRAHQVILVIMRIHEKSDPQRSQIALARHGYSAFLGLSQRGQQHARQHGDDGDDHQKLDQRERQSLSHDFSPF